MGADSRDRDALPRGLVEALLAAMRPVAPSDPEALKRRIFERIASEAGLKTVRGDEGSWTTIYPGVEVKMLHSGASTQTWLGRMRPGAELPAHEHRGDEECFVLEGTMRIGELELRPGDFHLAPAGTAHRTIRSSTGCVVLLRTRSP